MHGFFLVGEGKREGEAEGEGKGEEGDGIKEYSMDILLTFTFL